MENTNLKTVVLVGRPNVGKSTLFNRLIGKRQAIETEVPGTTRDRLYGEVSWQNRSFDLVDLAGIEFGSKKQIDKNIQDGVNLAIENADLVIFVVDWNDKSNEQDKLVARLLRKQSEKVVMAINKTDNVQRLDSFVEFNRLGNFDLVPVSAISGKNTGDLLDKVCQKLNLNKDKKIAKKDNDLIKLAIIGRPNVGKSTLINAIVGEKRVVVSEEAGTTRDTVKILFSHKGERIELLDTAGIRRKGKIEKDTIEGFSALRTYRAIKECDIAVLLVDAEEGLVAGDAHILGEAENLGKGLILTINKIDLWEEDQVLDQMAKNLGYLQQKLNFVPWLPIVFISAQDETNVKALLNQVTVVDKNRKTEIDQTDLDKVFNYAKEMNNQLINLISIKQKKTAPPIFEVIYKGPKPPHKTQIRYLENKIRDVYPMNGSPIFIDLVQRQRTQKNNR